MAFADENTIVQKYNIKTKKLLAPRPLRLADGTTSSLITDYFTARMSIGLHTETMLFLVTHLSPKTPVILGIPLLQKHEPSPNWRDLTINFTSTYCSNYCIPQQASDYKHPITPNPEHAKPIREDTPSNTLAPGRPIRHPTQQSMPYAHPTARLTARTQATVETRAVETAPPQNPIPHLGPAHFVQGRRYIPAHKGYSKRTSLVSTTGRQNTSKPERHPLHLCNQFRPVL